MRETVIEKYLYDECKKLNGKAVKFHDPSRRGAPDRLCLFHFGILGFVETKRPKGGALSVHQISYHEWLRDRNFPVFTCYAKVQVNIFIETMRHEIKCAHRAFVARNSIRKKDPLITLKYGI